jgi:putative phage-type endonuclease
MNVISPSIDHKAWLRERQNGIGASEVASVLGLPEAYETPLQVYARKVAFELPDDQPTEAMEWGNKLEPLIAQTYQERTGIPIVKTQVFRRDGFLFATLDGVDDVGQIVEFKTISERRASQVLGEQGTNEIPLPWILQAH